MSRALISAQQVEDDPQLTKGNGLVRETHEMTAFGRKVCDDQSYWMLNAHALYRHEFRVETRLVTTSSPMHCLKRAEPTRAC